MKRRDFIREIFQMFGAALCALWFSSRSRKSESNFEKVDITGTVHQGDLVNDVDSLNDCVEVRLAGICVVDRETGKSVILHVFPRELTPDEAQRLSDMTLAEIADLK